MGGYSMKVKVLMDKVEDKLTGAYYKLGQIIELEEERAKQAIKNGYVAKVIEDTKEKLEEDTKDETQDAPEVKEEMATGVTIKNNKPKKKSK
jgi:hypothetical protein